MKQNPERTRKTKTDEKTTNLIQRTSNIVKIDEREKDRKEMKQL